MKNFLKKNPDWFGWACLLTVVLSLFIGLLLIIFQNFIYVSIVISIILYLSCGSAIIFLSLHVFSTLCLFGNFDKKEESANEDSEKFEANN